MTDVTDFLRIRLYTRAHTNVRMLEKLVTFVTFVTFVTAEPLARSSGEPA